MITYQRTDQDEPQPVDDSGYLPDGTQVIFYPESEVQLFGPGIFHLDEPSRLDGED